MNSARLARLSVLCFFVVQSLAPSLLKAQTPPPSGPYGLDGAPTNIPSQNAAALGGQGSNNSAGNTAQNIGQQLLQQGQQMMGQCCGKPGQEACCAMGAMLMALGALAMAQSKGNKQTAQQHGVNASMNTDAGVPNTRSGDISKVTDFESIKDTMLKHGFTYNDTSGRFTTPWGTSFSNADLTNSQAMAAAGVTPEDFKKVMQMVKDAEAKAVAEESAKDSQATGFVGGANDFAMEPYPGDAAADAAMKAAQSPPTAVSGSSFRPQGAMGTESDSIFHMMARRYREKLKNDAFLPPDATPDETVTPSVPSLNQ